MASNQEPKGWRLDPIPSRTAYRDDDGNVRVPMWITRNGNHVADTEMVLLPSEVDLLRDQLADAMGSNRSLIQELFRGRTLSASGPGVVLVSKVASERP
ncbi:hypothetical protein ACFQVC_30170 [Streptomyces monticola]|uniref:Uncharacterized protein n=1 Tax=Streptomyces monticola TaxID=2666263 RepID=A0ABW2JRJ3_9ACTN